MKNSSLLPLIAIIFLTACAKDSVIYPLESKATNNDAIARGIEISSIPLTLDDARMLTIGWTSILDDASRNRRYSEIAAKEMIFYGTLLAVGGILGGSIALRNVGAAVAGAGVVTDQHYQFGEQRSVFFRASLRMQCASRVLDPLDPAILDALPTNASGLLVTAIGDTSDVPKHVSSYVNRVRQDLRVALASFELSTPSKQDIILAVSANQEQKRVADVSANRVSESLKNAKISVLNSGLRVQDCRPLEDDKSQSGQRNYRACLYSKESEILIMERITAFAKSAKSFDTDLDLCIKLNPQ